MGRAPCCDKANVKKGPWSPEEDLKLKDYIEKYGTGGNWIALPQKVGLKRCGKSCRLRWLNYLRPNIKHGEFSDEEDRIICTLFASIGSRWSIIAAQLPGRTDNDIKNYWNTKLKKKLMALAPQSQRKPLTLQSQPPPISSVTSISGSYPYVQTSNFKQFNGVDPILSTPTSSFLGNHSLNTYSYHLQGHEGLLNLMQYYQNRKDNMLVFGSDQASCSSNNSDGSYCSQIKQEEIGFQSLISSGYEENHKFMLSYGNNGGSDDHHHHQEEIKFNQWSVTTGDHKVNGNGFLGETSTMECFDINPNACNNNILIGENNKTHDKFMYYY